MGKDLRTWDTKSKKNECKPSWILGWEKVRESLSSSSRGKQWKKELKVKIKDVYKNKDRWRKEKKIMSVCGDDENNCRNFDWEERNINKKKKMKKDYSR